MQSLSDKVSEGLPKPKALQELVHRGKVSLDELKKHRTPQDCWIQIKDKVYDVSGNQPDYYWYSTYFTVYDVSITSQ